MLAHKNYLDLANTQRAQYSLIKDYILDYIRTRNMAQGIMAQFLSQAILGSPGTCDNGLFNPNIMGTQAIVMSFAWPRYS